MEIGTLVYLKNTEMLYKYIVYRPDKNCYLVEISSDIYKNINRYVEISKSEFEQNCVVEKKVYIHLMKERIKEYNNMVNDLELERVDNSLIDEKISLLKKELDTLQKIEEKTSNHLSTIRNLEKAIKRQNNKINSNSKKFTESIRHKVWEIYRKIDNLNEALEYLKK